MNLSRLMLFFGLVAFSASAQKISLLAPKGAGTKAVHAQLSESLCESYDCVPVKKLLDKGKPSWGKAGKLDVSVMVSVAVAGKGKKQKAKVSIFNKKGPAKWKQVFPLKNGLLSDKQMAVIQKNIDKALPKKKLREPVEEEAPSLSDLSPPTDSTPTQDNFPRPTERPEQAPPVEERKAEMPSATEETNNTGNPWLNADLGIEFTNRDLSYNKLDPVNLRSYSAPAIWLPKLGVEVRPFAQASHLGAGLALRASYATSIGFSSRIASNKDGNSSEAPAPENFPTNLSKFEVLAQYRWTLGKESAFTVIPVVGFRNTSFSIGKGSNGTMLDGFPGISYSALVLAAGVEIPIIVPLRLNAQFGFLPVLSSGDLISSKYFPSGTNNGLDGQVTLTYRLMQNWEVLATGQFTRYTMTFKPKESDTYKAQGATDSYLGGQAALRFRY